MFAEYQKSELIEDGSMVIMYASPRQMYPIIMKSGLAFDHSSGRYPHDSIIGHEYGKQILSHNKKGHLIPLHPSCELWTRNLPHRTQIVYTHDISVILSQLHLEPGMRVVESGTGSASLTHALARQVAPHGHVYTFEYHEGRADRARCEFSSHGLDHLVTVTQCNVYDQGFQLSTSSSSSSEDIICLDGTIDCVFLDLPEPWKAIPSTPKLFKSNKVGRICCFSPCIEQVQKNRAALVENGFTHISMFEVLPRSWEPRIASTACPPTNNNNSSMLSDISLNEEKVETTLASGDGTVAPVEEKNNKRRRFDVDEFEKCNNNIQEGAIVVAASPVFEAKGHSAYLTFATWLPAIIENN